jgi:hypothetical protein
MHIIYSKKMKKHLKIYITLALVMVSFINYAQTITGKVIDHSKLPLEDVYIYVLNSNNHIHTNRKGEFTLENVKIGDSLQVSHISYKTITLTIKKIDEPLTIEIEEKVLSLSEIIIPKNLNALKVFSDIILRNNPVNNSQDILKTVPGLIIGQHAGGGKAEQIFLRGFDIDHGTDISISVEGMPVNMVSHAHGQGYSDLHFVIPETIKQLDFDKGSYNSSKGNFATAGYVNFDLKERIEDSQIKLEVGDFNTQRVSTLLNIINTKNKSGYAAAEYSSTDGPFNSPQIFNRINLMGRYTNYFDNNDKISLLASHFSSTWNASGQIPTRSIPDIGRFGAIDDTEGGQTTRTNILLDYIKRIDDDSFIKNKIYHSKYEFDLYSNFTFFLENPIDGDQIRQKEERYIFGLDSEYNKQFYFEENRLTLQVGSGLRNDKVNENELSYTINRLIINENLALGDINETNLFGYINTKFNLGKWTVNPSIRIDYFKFNYYDRLQENYEIKSENKTTLSPKLNFLYDYSNNLQLYFKMGKGFHSNDTRVIVEQSGKEILPSVYGSDIGAVWKPIPKIIINSALWYLFSEQEFVYVGDGAVVEPSGKSRRLGVDFSMIYHPKNWLSFNADINYAHVRSVDNPDGKNYIPLAPDFTISSGISVNHPKGFFSSARLLHINDRPANEDNSIVAEGYSVVDFNVGYKWKKMVFGIEIRNLLNTEWNETQFATETRLKDEIEAVDEIHFIPGAPFNLKTSFTYIF